MVFAAVGTVILMAAVTLLIFRRLELFIPEFVISFLPQLVVLQLCLLLILYLLAGSAVAVAELLLLVTDSVLVLAVAWPLLNFSFNKALARPAGKTKLRIASFNKLLTNVANAAIAERINQLKPDVAGLLEVKPADYKALKKTVRLKHHYMSNYKYGLGKSEFLLFSKHPIKAVDILAIDNYSAVLKARLTYRRQPLTLLLVHTTAPIIPPLLEERNKSMRKLAKIIKKETGQLILMGDFNLTPWSQTYQLFVQALPGMYNVAQGSGLSFSWKLFPPLLALIDHIFASDDFKVESFVLDRYLGSDHKLIYTDLSLD